MKLIIKFLLTILSLTTLSACSEQVQNRPPKKEITTVKIINQPVSLKRSVQSKQPIRPLPLRIWQKQIHEKKMIYTNSNNILKDNS